jgi:hypothetical protein
MGVTLLAYSNAGERVAQIGRNDWLDENAVFVRDRFTPA